MVGEYGPSTPIEYMYVGHSAVLKLTHSLMNRTQALVNCTADTIPHGHDHNSGVVIRNACALHKL